MATPNYGYEKRQKEQAKRHKKEEKLKAKAERKSGDGLHGDSQQDQNTLAPAAPPASAAAPGALDGQAS